MDKAESRLTVFFEESFYVGIFERYEGGNLSVAKVTFGAEPREHEVYEFILKHHRDLAFSPTVDAAVREEKRNPKRVQREVRQQMKQTGVGTKAQQALKLQQEQFKTERKEKSKEKKEAEAERKFELKQQKRKEKHRGR